MPGMLPGTEKEQATMPDLTLSVPHQLGRAEARRRVQELATQLKQQQGAVMGHLDERWTGDPLDFTFTAMGQAFPGRLVVEDAVVRLNVTLPWIFTALTENLRQAIEQQGQKLLGGPAPAGASGKP